MRIWVDADSCPRRIREIVCRASDRKGIEAVFVANRPIPLPNCRTVRMERVGAGQDDADRYIVEHIEEGDLIITRDIPLAALLVEKSFSVLNDRGDLYTRENVRERLSVRNFMADLREAGLPQDTPGQLSEKDIRTFANTFDRELVKAMRAAKARRAERERSGTGSAD
jgi:uncharacterized protein YaiI (UPF0178 family)